MVRGLLTIAFFALSPWSVGQTLNFSIGLANSDLAYGGNVFDIQSDNFTLLDKSELIKINRSREGDNILLSEKRANRQGILRLAGELKGRKQWGVELWSSVGIARGSDYMGRIVQVRTEKDLLSPLGSVGAPAGTVETFGLFHPSLYSSSGLNFYIPIIRRRRVNMDLQIGFGRTSISNGKPYDKVLDKTDFETTSASLVARRFRRELAQNEFKDAATFGFSTSILGIRLRYGSHHFSLESVNGVSNPFRNSGDETPWISHLSQVRIGYAYNFGMPLGKAPGWFDRQFNKNAFERAEELRADIRKSTATISKLETSIFIGLRYDLFLIAPFNDSANYYVDSVTVYHDNDTIRAYARYGHDYNPSVARNEYGKTKLNQMVGMQSIPVITVDVRRDISRYFEIGASLGYGMYKLFPAGTDGANDLTYPVDYKAFTVVDGQRDSLISDFDLNTGHRRLHVFSIRPHFAIRTKRTALTEFNLRGGLKFSVLHANFEEEDFTQMPVESDALGSSDPQTIYDMESFNPNIWVMSNQFMVHSMIGADYERGRWEFSLTLEGRVFGGFTERSYINGFGQVGIGVGYKVGYWQR